MEKKQPILVQVLLTSGKLGTGKNFVAERILHPMLPVQPTLFLAFANHYKVEAIVKDGLDRARVFGEKDEATRRSLQLRGTELGRDVFGPDIWVELAMEWMHAYLPLGYTRIFFTDARFPNEVDSVQSLNGTELELLGQTYRFEVTSLRMVAPRRSQARAEAEAAKSPGTLVTAITEHISETALDDHVGFSYKIYNDVDQDVYPTLKAIARMLTAQAAPYLRYVVDVDDTICQCGVYYTAVLLDAEQRLRRIAEVLGLDPGMAAAALQWEFTEVHAREHQGVFSCPQFGTDVRDAFLRAGLTLATAVGFPVNVDADSEVLYQAGLAVFDQPYPALAGALEAVAVLSSLGQVVLYTHGDRVEQVAKIARLGLSHLPIFVTPNKGLDSLTQLMAEYPAVNYVSIGDNFRRESQPAVQLHFARTYWITPDWASELPVIDTARELGIQPVLSIVDVARAEQVRAVFTNPQVAETAQ